MGSGYSITVPEHDTALQFQSIKYRDLMFAVWICRTPMHRAHAPPCDIVLSSSPPGLTRASIGSLNRRRRHCRRRVAAYARSVLLVGHLVNDAVVEPLFSPLHGVVKRAVEGEGNQQCEAHKAEPEGGRDTTVSVAAPSHLQQQLRNKSGTRADY